MFPHSQPSLPLIQSYFLSSHSPPSSAHYHSRQQCLHYPTNCKRTCPQSLLLPSHPYLTSYSTYHSSHTIPTVLHFHPKPHHVLLSPHSTQLQSFFHYLPSSPLTPVVFHPPFTNYPSAPIPPFLSSIFLSLSAPTSKTSKLYTSPRLRYSILYTLRRSSPFPSQQPLSSP